MSELLNSSNLSNLSKEQMKKRQAEIMKKWSASGLLEGLTDSPVKENIAQLMESQAQHLLNETVIEVSYSADTIVYPLLPVAIKLESKLLALDVIWYVYILRCGDGSLYTGITNDVDKRLEAHRSGKGAKYTRGRLPLTLELSKGVAGKSEALKLEYKVKKQPSHRKIPFLMSYGEEKG